MFSNGFPKEWSTLRKLMWLYRCALAAAGQYVTVTGSSPLALANSLAHAIKSLTQFGKCTQEAGASPSTPKAIYCNNGEIKYGALGANLFDTSPACIKLNFYIQASDGTEQPSTTNFTYISHIPVEPGKSYVFYGRKKSSNTMSQYNRIAFFEADGTYISTATYPKGAIGKGVAPENAAYCILSCNLSGESAAVGTPISQEIIDSYNWMFAEGTAEITPFVPFVGGIYTDGTPEVLTAGGQNLVDLTAVTDGYYYNASGVYATADATRLTDYIPVRAGQKYTVYAQAVQSGSSVNVRCNLFDTGKVWKSQSVLVVAAGNSAVSTITPAENGFLRVSANYTGTREKVDWSTFQIVRGEYTLSTMPPYEPYITPQTVNDIPMLLGLGDTVRDEWDAISGLLTGKVGVKVFDGTEDWGASSSANIYILASAIGVGLTAICTHFQKVANSTSAVNMSDGTFKGHASNAILYFKDVSAGNVDGFKARLAAQYAAGTPVIMPYALATETTEQTTPHSLHTVNGTTIVEAATAVDPVELACEYYAATS